MTANLNFTQLSGEVDRGHNAVFLFVMNLLNSASAIIDEMRSERSIRYFIVTERAINHCNNGDKASFMEEVRRSRGELHVALDNLQNTIRKWREEFKNARSNLINSDYESRFKDGYSELDETLRYIYQNDVGDTWRNTALRNMFSLAEEARKGDKNPNLVLNTWVWNKFQKDFFETRELGSLADRWLMATNCSFEGISSAGHLMELVRPNGWNKWTPVTARIRILETIYKLVVKLIENQGSIRTNSFSASSNSYAVPSYSSQSCAAEYRRETADFDAGAPLYPGEQPARRGYY